MKTASLVFTCSGDRECRALKEVLAPDNKGGPRELRISVKIKGRSLEYRISSPTPSTAVSTALGILRDVSLFEEVWLLSHRADSEERRTRT